MSENGATVVITGKDSKRLEKSVTKIPNSVGFVADIRKTDEVKNVVIIMDGIIIWVFKKQIYRYFRLKENYYVHIYFLYLNTDLIK